LAPRVEVAPFGIKTHRTSCCLTLVVTALPRNDLGIPKNCCFIKNDAAFFSFKQNYVKNGGGLLVAGQAWYWSENGITDKVHYANGYPGNK
jgi:uncharacterized membrane protein